MTSNLSKLFESAEEVIEPEEAIISGEIPEWLNGSFVRVGPGKWDLGNFTMNHFLDGYALLSKFEIRGQTVKFQQKFLESDAYLKGISAGKPVVTEFGTKAYSNTTNKGIFSRIISSLTPPEMTDNANCSLFQLPNKDLFVTSNTTFFRRVNGDDLSTGDKYDYSKCFGVNGVSVHPLRDEHGDQYNIGFSVAPRPKYNIIKIPGDEKYGTCEDLMKHSTTIASIPSRWNTGVAFFHSFGMSSNYIIFMEIPYIISLTKAAKSLIKGDALKDWMEWKPDEVAKFHVIEKRTGKVRKIDYVSSKPFFFLHVVNCYEQENQIVIDLNTYTSPAVIDSLDIQNLRSNAHIGAVDPPCLMRYVLPLTSDLCSLPASVNLITLPDCHATAFKQANHIILSPEEISPPGLELPMINPHFQGKRNSFLYASGTICKNLFTNSISKINLTSKERLTWQGSNFDYPGEALFIPQEDHVSASSAIAEEDGILISAVSNSKWNGNQKTSKDFLVFINPKNMKEIGRASFKARIPQAMHGIFLRD